MGVNSLPETVTRQRHDCDLNPGRTAPESSTLSTRLPSHHPHAVALHVSRYSASMRCVFAELDPFLFDSHGAAVSAGRRRASCAGYQLRAIYRRRRTERGFSSSSSSTGSPVGYSSRSMRAAKFEARAVGFAGLGQRLPV